MKKLLLLGFAVLTLSACMGRYHDGRCDYDYFLHPQISFSRLIGCPA
ncbi:MAG: YhfL family protein [Proteobacteria bacterium]|nr:YhfL family protein [Pseudomonadota bacterium]